MAFESFPAHTPAAMTAASTAPAAPTGTHLAASWCLAEPDDRVPAPERDFEPCELEEREPEP